jgi:iron complex outermembrane receptor protein
VRLLALRLTTALGVVLAGQSAFAAEDVDPFALSPEQLFQATIMSVSKTPEKLGEAPAAIYVLTSEDIARSGATSIPELLRLVPGVQVARVNSAGWAISVRGFNSTIANKLLVLIDGRSVYDPLFSGVYWDIQDTALEDIERIEVIRGPGASLWGANAVNGVINIITKNAAQTTGLLLSVVAGNQERAIFTARFGGEAGPGVHWRVYGKYLNRSEQQTLAKTDANDDWTAWRGGFRVDSEQNTRGDTFTLQGDAYHSESGQLRNVAQLTPPYMSLQTDDITAKGGNLLGRWSRALGEDSSLTVQSYVDVTEREQVLLKDRRVTFDLDAQYLVPALGRHKVIAGLGYRYSVDDLTATPSASFVKSSQAQNLFTGFVQDEITLLPERLFLTLGAKFEDNYFTGFEIQPNARGHWDLDATQTVWASVSRAVRTPSELERNLRIVQAAGPPVGPFPLPISIELIPNPGFYSEELMAYEIGYRRQWTADVLTDISAFYNDYDSLAGIAVQPLTVGTDPLHFVIPLALTNSVKAETYGFEAVANWRAEPNLNFSAGYSLLKMVMYDPPGNPMFSAKSTADQSPQQQFNLRSQWDISPRLALDTTVYYVAPLRAYQINAYWRLDARLGWRLADGLQIDLVGQNLLTESHREFSGATDTSATRIGRSVFGRLTWRS